MKLKCLGGKLYAVLNQFGRVILTGSFSECHEFLHKL